MSSRLHTTYRLSICFHWRAVHITSAKSSKMDAQGALDSLLGRLTAILVDETQLLGGLQGDVEFIKDEMESMNGLLLHLTEAHHRDHQVRAWMKQVVGLTRDCEGNVELYIQYVGGAGPGARKGVLGSLLRMLRFVHGRCTSTRTW